MLYEPSVLLVNSTTYATLAAYNDYAGARPEHLKSLVAAHAAHLAACSQKLTC